MPTLSVAPSFFPQKGLGKSKKRSLGEGKGRRADQGKQLAVQKNPDALVLKKKKKGIPIIEGKKKSDFDR